MASPVAPGYPITIDGETVHVGTAGELVIALDVLQGQHDRMVLQQLASHLAEVIGGPVGLMSSLRSLSPADQIFLIDSLGPRLGELLPAARHLRDLMAVLAESTVEERLLEALGTEKLRRLIATAGELGEVLEWLYGQCDQRLLDLLGADHLRRLVTSGQELSRVLHSLDAERQSWLLEVLGWEKVRPLATSGRDLAYMMGALPPSLSEWLLGQYTREQLIALIDNDRDWQLLCRRLEAAELAQLCALLGVEYHA